MMVRAGQAVDEVLTVLTRRLSPGDVVMDGGNSFFRDTERRMQNMEKLGINYFGVGVSGGAEGALRGPCLMVGGPEDAYGLVESILTKIAAQLEDGPCCSHLGPGGAGHLTKMVHNGIEYAFLQLIAEGYDI